MSNYIIRNRFLEVCRWPGDAVFSIDLNSGYEDHKPHLSIIIARLYILFRLPKWIIQPYRRKVSASGSWDAATVARLGRDWYYDETRREFGVSIAPDVVRVKYGTQTDSWPGDKVWSVYFPWMKWRCVELRWIDYLGAVAERVADSESYEVREQVKQRAPAMVFEFSDFDGERIEATVRIEEFEHARGTGRWKWLDLITRRRVGRRLDVEFSKETGRRKGSWKGGMRACNSVAKPGELHAAAFYRYAAEEGFTKLKHVV